RGGGGEERRGETDGGEAADGRAVVGDPDVDRELELELEPLREHPGHARRELDGVAPGRPHPGRGELDVLFHERALCKDRLGGVGPREVPAPSCGRMERGRGEAGEEDDGDDWGTATS